MEISDDFIVLVQGVVSALTESILTAETHAISWIMDIMENSNVHEWEITCTGVLVCVLLN